MATVFEENPDGRGRRVAVAVAAFNRDVTGALLEGCLHALAAAGVAREDVTVAWVPGAFELPLACDRLAATGRFHAVVALGAVIRGETPHFDYVAGECARGLARVSLDRSLPVAFGVLTTDTLEQARRRASLDPGVLGERPPEPESPARDDKVAGLSNKGAEAARAALAMAALLDRI